MLSNDVRDCQNNTEYTKEKDLGRGRARDRS